MRTIPLALTVLGLVLGELASSPEAAAQETFFQVPAGQVAPHSEVFSQVQTTVFRDKLDAAAQGVFGLGRGFEVGLSFYNFDFERTKRGPRLDRQKDPGDEPLGPLALFTAQKSFSLAKHFELSLGLQTGTQLPGRDKHLVSREYLNAIVPFTKNTRCVVGGYHGNGAFFGGPRRFGLWAGCDVEIIPKRLAVEADVMTGKHSLGATSVGPKFLFSEDVSVTAGVQIPTPGSEARWGGIAQLEVDDFLGLFLKQLRNRTAAERDSCRTATEHDGCRIGH